MSRWVCPSAVPLITLWCFQVLGEHFILKFWTQLQVFPYVKKPQPNLTVGHDMEARHPTPQTSMNSKPHPAPPDLPWEGYFAA